MVCNSVSATVAFIDIKSAAKAHSSENKIEERTLKTDYYEPHRHIHQHHNNDHLSSKSLHSGTITTINTNTAATSSGTVSSTTSATSSATSAVAAASSSSTSSSSISATTPLSSNASLYGRHTPSRYNSNSTLSHETNNINNNNNTSVQASSTHHHSCVGGGSGGVASGGSSSSSSSVGGHQNFPGVSSPQDDRLSIASSNDREDLRQTTTAICVRKLSHRLTDSNIKDSLFYEFKRHGKIVNTFIRGQGFDRFAVVVFSKPEEAERAVKESNDKQFLGSRVEITLCDYPEIIDDCKSNDPDQDYENFCHPRATRTLFVGNLDKEVTEDDLSSRFSQFGQILDIEIKKQNQPYAFIRYSDIPSVVKAIRKYDNEFMGSTRLKLGYGKSFHSSCICIGNYKEIFCDLKAIEKYLNKYGQVKKMVHDHEQKTALCFFETRDEANKAVDDLKAKMINGRRVEVELASRDFQTYFMEHKIAKPNETNSHGRSRSGSWMSANSVDYDERSYDRNRNTSLHHHHQSSSSRSSSSSLCQVRSNNNSVSSSYSSMRQRSQSPSSPTDNLTPFSNSFNSRHSSITQSSLHGGSTNRISSKYEYHHDSSNSCRSSSRPSYNRYESPADDVDDVDDESHLSSSSKRDSRYSSSRSHYMSENFLSDASPKIRRDSSPYGSSYSNSSKLDSDVFHRSNRGSTQNDEIKSSSHDDGHSSSLRRAVHSSSKIYNKNCRDVSPSSHVSQYRKTGLSSSSSSSTSSNSRSPIREAKSSSHYQERTSSVSPSTSPRANPYSSSSSYHESDRQTHSSLNDANIDHQSQSWRRKSTEDNNGCHRDHQNSISTTDLLQRARSDSVSDVSDSNFSLLNNSSHRDLSRDYFRDRFRESHHRTNSITSTTLAYQNRNDSIKRKTIYSSLGDSVDENSSDLPGHLERRKRLLACVEQPPAAATNSSSTVTAPTNNSVSSIHSSGLSTSNAVTNSSVTKANVEQRITSSKSLDSSSDSKLHPQKSRESTNLLDNSSTGLTVKRRPSNSSLSNNTNQLPNCNDAANNTSFKDLKPIFEHYLAEGKLSETQASAVLTLLQDQSKSQVNRNLLNSTSSSSSCNVGIGLSTSSLTTANSTKPKTKDGCPIQASLRIIDVTSPMVNHSIGDRRLSGHNARYNKISHLVTRTNCDTDLNNKNSKSSETLSSQQRTITNLEFGPSSPWNLPLPEFAIPQQLKSSTVGNDQFKSHQISTSIVITSSTTTTTSTSSTTTSSTSSSLSTINSNSASGTNLTHIPNLTNTAPTTTAITSTSSTSPKNASIMSPLGNLSPVPKNRFSRDNRLSTETNSFDFNTKSKSSNDLDDVSDSDLGTLMIEDKIKALDEKYNAWSGTASTTPTMKSEKTPTIDYSKYNIKKKSQSTSSSNSNSALLSSNSNSNEHESTDMIKNILSTKSSVFDQDSKRLEYLNEKYEQKDVSTLDLDSIGSHKILSSSRSKFPNNPTSIIPSSLVLPTEKIIQSMSLVPLPTTSTSSSSTPTLIVSSSSSSSLFHSSHHNHHSSSSSSTSSTNAIPTSSSSISRKISESSRTNQIKKDYLLGTSTSLSSPTTPGSAPVRSSSSMFPQFSRSSSIPTNSMTPNTPTNMSSTSANSSRPSMFLLNSTNRKDSSATSNNSSNHSVNRPTNDAKYKLDSISKSMLSSSSRSLDVGGLSNINNKTTLSSLTNNNNNSCKPDHQGQAKRDHSLTKSSSVPDQSLHNNMKTKYEISSKNDFCYTNSSINNNIITNINKKEMERKISELSSGSHNNNNNNESSGGSGASHHHSLKDHIKSQKSNHSTKEPSKDEQSGKKQQQQMEKDKTSRELKSEMSSPPISKEKNSSKKSSNAGEMILSSNNKDKEKIKKKTKDKEYSSNHHQQKDNNKEQANQKQTDQQTNKQKSRLSERRESNKEKMKNFQESSNNKEKKKDKHKESKEKNKENKNKLFELDDEPIYFSMYDKVKARSSANQSLKVAKTSNDHLDNVRQKLNQLKDKRHNRNKDDDHHNKNSKSSEDSDEDSDSSFDQNNFKQKKLMKKRRAIVKSDSSSDEDDDDEESFSHVSISMHHGKKSSKKLLVNDDEDSDSEVMESYHNNVKENKSKKSIKREQVNKFFTDDSSDTSATEMTKSSSFKQNKMNKSTRTNNNKMSDVDESSEDDSSTLCKFTKKRKKLKKDKDKEKFGLSNNNNNNNNSKDKHEMVDNQNKLKDHHSKYNKKNKIQEKQSSLSSHKETSSIQEGKIKSTNEKEKRTFVIKSDDDSDFVHQKMMKCFSNNSSSSQKKKKKKSKSSSKEKRHCSPMKDGFAKDSNRISTMNKLKHEIFSDDNESSDASAMTINTNNNKKQRTRNQWKLTDSESETTMHQIFKSCKEYKDETRDARMMMNSVNKSSCKMDKQQVNKQSIKQEMMAAMMMENSKMKDDRFSKNNKISNKSSFSMMSENQKISKYEDSNCDSMKENVNKKKKKSSKNKDKEKVRKDSASNDSSDKTSNHSSYDQRHPCKSSIHFNELNLFRHMSSPPSSNQDVNLCHSGSNLLDPSKSSILIASPPPKTPEISSPRSSPSHYVENIIISHVDDESSYIDSKIDEDLINESQTILRHCNENSSSDSCLSDSLVHDSVSPVASHTNEFNIMLSVQTSSLGQLVKPVEIICNDSYPTKSPSPFEQKHHSYEDEVAIQSLKLQKELETENSKCVDSKIDIMHHSLSFPPFDTTTSHDKTNIEKLSFRSSSPVSAKCDDNQITTIFSNAEAVENINKISINEDQNKCATEFNSEIECQRKIEDDLAVAALLQDMNDPCALEEPNIAQSGEIETNNTHHELPIPSFLNIISPNNNESVVLQQFVDNRPVVMEVSDSTGTITTTGDHQTVVTDVVVVDDQELEAAVQEIEFVAQDTIKKEVVVVKPDGAPIVIPPVTLSVETCDDAIMFNDDDDNVEHELVVDENVLDKSLQEDLPDMSPTDIQEHDMNAEPVSNVNEFISFSTDQVKTAYLKSSSSSIIDDLNTNENTITIEIEQCLTNVPSQDLFSETIFAKSSSTVDEENIAKSSQQSEENQKTIQLSMPILTSMDSDNKETTKLDISMSPRGQHQNIEQQPIDKPSDEVQFNKDSIFMDTSNVESEVNPEDAIDKIDASLDQNMDVERKPFIGKEENLSSGNEDTPMINESCLNKNNKRTFDELEIDTSNENICSKPKRGRKAKNRKNSDSSLHSPRSEQGQNESTPLSTTLTINTNLSVTNAALLSPASQSPVATSYSSDISPGSQTKRSKQQHTTGYNIFSSVRRSVRTAAVAASAVNSTTLEELEDTDYSMDEQPSNKEEHEDDAKNGVKKQSKRGRKKKNFGNTTADALNIKTDDNKKPLLTVSNTNTNRPKSSISPYDVFEFTDDEDQGPLTLDHIKPPHFMLSMAEDKRHQNENADNTCPTLTVKQENTSEFPLSQQSGTLVSSGAISKEYVSEVNQSGKLVIRLQDSAIGGPECKSNKDEIKSEECSNAVTSSLVSGENNNNNAQTIKGVRKSARLMSQGTKINTEDEEVTLKTNKLSNETTTEKGACKRVTRSYRKSDDAQHSTNATGSQDSSDDQDESKATLRTHRITRSRGGSSSTQEQTTDLVIKKDPDVGSADDESTVQEPLTTSCQELSQDESNTVSTPISLGNSETSISHPVTSTIAESTPEYHPLVINAPIIENKKSESTSVIQSTGNVEKIITPDITVTTTATTTTIIVPLSTPSTSANISPVITNSSTVVVSNSPSSVITSTPSPNYNLQDIPNISDRIHHSPYTPVKLKTGKGLVFDNFKAPIIVSGNDNNQQQQQQSKVTESVTSTPNVQPVMIKPKYQHPVGQAAEIRPKSPINVPTSSSISVVINDPIKNECHILSPSAITPPSMADSMKNLNIQSSQSSHTSVPIINKTFTQNKSVLQATGSNNAQVQDLNLSYPGNLLPSTSPHHLTSTISSDVFNIQSQQQKDYLSSLQKHQQQIIPNNNNNRSTNQKSDSISEFMTSSLNNNDLPPSTQATNHPMPNPAFAASMSQIRPPPVSSANLYEYEMAMHNPLIWSSFPQGIRGIPLTAHRFIYPGPAFLSQGINPEQVEQQAQQTKSKPQQKEGLIRPPFIEHPGQEQQPFSFDMASLGSTAQRNFSMNPNLRHFSQLIPPHDSPTYLQYGLNGQGRNFSMPSLNYGGVPNNTEISKQLQSQSPSLEQKRPSSKPSITVQDTAIYPSNQRPLPSPAHSPAYRKEMPPELNAEILRNQISNQFGSSKETVRSASPPLNMSYQRVASPNLPQPLSRPSSGCSVEQATLMNKRTSNVEPSQITPPPVTNSATPSHIVPQNSPNCPSNSSNTPQHVILQRHPMLWQGLLTLKNEQAAVQMHYVCGNRNVAVQALPFHESNSASLRITQRMRFEPSQLQSLENKIQSKDECCILLALPCGRDQVDVLTQSNNLRKYFITYLQSKLAAGIVNDSAGFITHIFPPCDFSEQHLVQTAPDMLHHLSGISHLMVVITTTTNSTNHA
ncbi:hypothetical protein HUG17_5259 [Dermatophagoides farinae]|uniref:Protein split ends n=1 Tax=Dermatophagoides farinae TaxID=6954 RepID=A0A9D4P207_DERFA|nr:hypothetical protein HUG17_5259 [Dermatophagoides farinae]